MTARKMTKTAVTTEEFETHSVPNVASMPDTGRPYILESAEFDAFVHGKRKSAQREIDSLDAEIHRLQVEIEARLARRQDLMSIVIKADAMLSMRDVSPAQIGERVHG